MAQNTPGGDGLGRWLVGGLAAGALLLALILGSYALGGHNAASPGTGSSTLTTTTEAPVTPPPATEGASPAAGDPVAGETTFAQSCSGCHLQNGTEAGGVGPKLQGLGLSADRITRQIEDGSAAMSGGLVAGEDLTNVVAYVVSIQR